MANFRHTRFRTVCPRCGHVGRARWSHELNVASCVACGSKFDPYRNAFRPVTGGMTDEERAEYYRESRRRLNRERRRDPDKMRHDRKMERLRHDSDEYRAMQRERSHAYYLEHRDEINARRRVGNLTHEELDRRRERDRRYYAEHRDAINFRRNKRKLAERGK